jgi:hypothetical protein
MEFRTRFGRFEREHDPVIAKAFQQEIQWANRYFHSSQRH